MDSRVFALRRLYLALQLSDRLGRCLKMMRRAPTPQPFAPGISVLIPERASSILLSDCLASVDAACDELDEPCEVIVIVNGSPRSQYDRLVRRHKRVRWIFSESPLWFGGAINRGLREVRYDWVYLLNNDMVVDAQAFHSLLPFRAPHVFGIASQIFFQDPDKDREETGWTVCREDRGVLEIGDKIANDDASVRGVFYPGGGASLFRRDLLARLAKHTSVYAPFYWEDVEWGTCAWRLGYQSLYCPISKVWHEHRQTNRKFFSESQINRILKRNGFIYHLRNRPLPASFAQFRELLARLDKDSVGEILTNRRITQIALGRLRNGSRWLQDVALESTWQRVYGSVDVSQKASVIQH
jgi:GT2 family glycosyltransferase